MDTTTLTIIGIYLVSCFCSYKYIQIAHGKSGRWSTLDTGKADFFVCFFPLLNTIVSFAWLFIGPYNKSRDYNNFFRVKK